MKTTFRGLVLAAAATFLGAGSLWAHPGHVTEGGVWHTLAHTFSSPYHVAVIGALVVLGIGIVLAARPGRRVRHQADPPSA